ncbi:hypothetical protein [Actinoplanes sp. M2I2]|uniref:hypothetical protein n=1 Tax=Actinoplanes sp. M2I2 TaxID=1734444 RepID=UPI00202160A0|nr:hypothetical protein [Actinoplanes sp. M2I2]
MTVVGASQAGRADRSKCGIRSSIVATQQGSSSPHQQRFGFSRGSHRFRGVCSTNRLCLRMLVASRIVFD